MYTSNQRQHNTSCKRNSIVIPKLLYITHLFLQFWEGQFKLVKYGNACLSWALSNLDICLLLGYSLDSKSSLCIDLRHWDSRTSSNVVLKRWAYKNPPPPPCENRHLDLEGKLNKPALLRKTRLASLLLVRDSSAWITIWLLATLIAHNCEIVKNVNYFLW